METWKAIPGYEGIYEASSAGRIRTCDGKTTHTERHGVRHWKQRIMRQKFSENQKGRKDARVILWKDGKDKTFLVARLIAMAFLPLPCDKLTVNHINGNPLDNRAENLEWVTLSENIRHGFRTGLYAKAQKSVNLISESSGEVIPFESMADASRWLGKNEKYVSCCFARGCSAISTAYERYTIVVIDP